MNTTSSLKNFLISHPNLYERYGGILSLSNISLLLLDLNGNILHEFITSPDFCKHVCQERKTRICSDYISQFEAEQEKHFTCRYGLYNILLPILTKGKKLGYIAGIQAYSQDMDYQKYMIDIPSLAAARGLESSFIAKSISVLKTIEKNKIDIHEQLCGHIANNISLDFIESEDNTQAAIARLSIEKEILEKKIIDLETKNRSLVINPHFLFNTLNSIARIAYFEHSHTTEELIYCLSDLLRYNVRQEDQMHTIGSEIDNIKKYLYIQKARFKDRLKYEFRIDDHIKPYRILNMAIQPVVENALLHGITPKRDGGKINIYAEKYKNKITISVSDDGYGFPEDILQSIYKAEDMVGVGFRNTDRRLKQHYGEQFGLKIVKSDYSGSTVTITIPTSPK